MSLNEIIGFKILPVFEDIEEEEEEEEEEGSVDEETRGGERKKKRKRKQQQRVAPADTAGQKKTTVLYELFFRQIQADECPKSMKVDRTLLISNIPHHFTEQSVRQLFGDEAAVKRVSLQSYSLAPLSRASVTQSSMKNIGGGRVNFAAGSGRIVLEAQRALLQFKTVNHLQEALSLSLSEELLTRQSHLLSLQASRAAATAAQMPILDSDLLDTGRYHNALRRSILNAAKGALMRSIEEEKEEAGKGKRRKVSEVTRATDAAADSNDDFADAVPAFGLGKWTHEYDCQRPEVKSWQESINQWLASFDARQDAEERELELARERVDDDGFVVVQGRGRKRQRSGSVVVTGSVAKAASAAAVAAAKRKAEKAKQMQGLYKFQRRQRQQEELQRLQNQFEQDKRRIARLQQPRKPIK